MASYNYRYTMFNTNKSESKWFPRIPDIDDETSLGNYSTHHKKIVTWVLFELPER